MRNLLAGCFVQVGDAYVAIAGYPNDDPDHALTALRLVSALGRTA